MSSSNGAGRSLPASAMVHRPESGRIYAVRVEDVPGTCMYLRPDPTVNGQAKGVHRARAKHCALPA